MKTHKQLFSTTSSGRLTAASKRHMAEFLETAKRARSLSALLPRERRDQYAINDGRTALVPIDDTTAQAARSAVAEANPRKKNITQGRAGYKAYTAEELIQYRGRYKGYTGSNLVPVVQSVGRISSDGTVMAMVLDGKNFVVHAGRGYHWAVDNIGIKLIKTATGDEYHPDSAAVAEGFAAIRARLINRAQVRKAAMKAHIGRKASLLETVKKLGIKDKPVSITDSVHAGNCRAGTIAFAQSLGIDPGKPITAGRLVKIVTKHLGRLPSYQIDRLSTVLHTI